MEITLESQKGKPVSATLTGMNMVYSRENHASWKDGSKLQELKDAGISCLRYPGGHVVSFWDWEFPYHPAYQNFWDPTYEKSLTPEKKAELKNQNSSRVSLEQFLNLCEEGGMEPIVGINMFQGYTFDRLEESIAKAVRLVEHCRTQTPKVIYYYLDNEAGHQPEKGNHIPVDDYIDLIPAYSRAIKRVQPDAKIIVNTIGWKGVNNMIHEAGAFFDVLDYHWYYNNGDWGRFSSNEWREESRHPQFEKRVREFNAWKRSSGHDHLKLALLEWNLGPANGEGSSDRGTPFWQGLVQADMLLSCIQHDVFMAACWPLTWSRPTDPPGGFIDFIDARTGEAGPSKHLFAWINTAAGGNRLPHSTTDASHVRVSTILHQDGQTLLVYLLNKTTEPVPVHLRLTDPVSSIQAQSFQRKEEAGDAVVVDVPVKADDGSISLLLADTSFTFLQLGLKQEALK